MAAEWLYRHLMDGPYVKLCLSEADWARVLRRLKAPPEPFPTSAAKVTTFDRVDNGHPVCLVTLSPGHETRDPIQICGLLVHEAVHVWQAWCAYIGEASPGKEEEAYAIQHIAQRLMQDYKERVIEA